jgi:hypothetical protein
VVAVVAEHDEFAVLHDRDETARRLAHAAEGRDPGTVAAG